MLVGAALAFHMPVSRTSGVRMTVSDPPTTATSLYSLQSTAKDDIRGIIGETLFPESAYWIGKAFRKWLGSSDMIAVGRDPRTSSLDISSNFARGAEAMDAGPATTPAMLEALLAPSSAYAGSVMVTASHLPSQYNGMKLFARDLGRGLNKNEVKEVMALAVEMGTATGADATVAASSNEAVRMVEGFMSPYLEKLREAVKIAAADGSDQPLKGMKICVNPGNGAGGVFASEVLQPLGADTSVSIHLEPDGTFPNHMPNPEDKAHVKATVDAVASSGADVGVMLDTDVDRCGLIDGCVSPPGELNRNRLIALCALDALEANGGRGVIVTDSVTSKGMGPFIEQRGGTHDRYKMGYRNVIDRAAETEPEPALLAIETSGHSAWRDNKFVDDGCYTAARLIGRLARERRASKNPSSLGLLELLGGSLDEPAESIKVKMKVGGGLEKVPLAEASLCASLQRATGEVAGWEIEKVNHDGLRASVGRDGWLIIRGSLHEPSVSVQTESDTPGGTAEICKTLADFCGDECEVLFDLEPMRKAGGVEEGSAPPPRMGSYSAAARREARMKAQKAPDFGWALGGASTDGRRRQGVERVRWEGSVAAAKTSRTPGGSSEPWCESEQEGVDFD